MPAPALRPLPQASPCLHRGSCPGAAEPTQPPEPTAAPVETEAPAAAEPGKLILATTTSTARFRFAGLFAARFFEEESNVEVDVIAVGTGQAITLGEDGNADVLLVHARAREDAFMDAGHGVRREDVMYNDFVIVGPADDPAGIKGMTDAADALAQIAAAEAPFVSRGDESGTHTKEKSHLGGGRDRTCRRLVHLRRAGHGRGAHHGRRAAGLHAERPRHLPGAHPGRHRSGDRGGRRSDPVQPLWRHRRQSQRKTPRSTPSWPNQFIDWLISIPAQEKIAQFGVDEFGEPLFVPDSELWREAK